MITVVMKHFIVLSNAFKVNMESELTLFTIYSRSLSYSEHFLSVLLKTP